jgi:hypothetical protein
MKVKAFILVLASTLFLMGCPAFYNNFEDFADDICKVRGKVVDPYLNKPIISVEVFVNGYQYSELTNNEGDYELELPKGTWELIFKKIGYVPVKEEVTLDSNNPRVEITTYMHQDLTFSRVLYYPFNNYAYDESGKGNHGTIFGALPSTDRFGNPDKAYWFDGIDDYINAFNSESLNPPIGVTVCAWILLESYPDDNTWVTIVDKTHSYILSIHGKTGDKGVEPGLVLTIWDRRWYGITRNTLPQDDFMLNEWYHVAGTYDENTGEGVLYIDGVPQSVGPNYNGWPEDLLPSADNVYIGSQRDLNWQWFHGKIDSVSIFNRALTEEEIEEIYNTMD